MPLIYFAPFWVSRFSTHVGMKATRAATFFFIIFIALSVWFLVLFKLNNTCEIKEEIPNFEGKYEIEGNNRKKEYNRIQSINDVQLDIQEQETEGRNDIKLEHQIKTEIAVFPAPRTAQTTHVPFSTDPRKLDLQIQFREGKVDWHLLIKPTEELLELISYEKKLLQMLISHEPAKPYEFFPFISDGCVLLNKGQCEEQPLCHWCRSNALCVSKIKSDTNYQGKMCPDSFDLKAYSKKSKSIADGLKWVSRPYGKKNEGGSCDYYIPQKVFSIDFIGSNSVMFYHFLTESLPFFMHNATDVVLVYSTDDAKKIVTEYAEYLALFSSISPLDVRTLPKNICFKLFEDIGHTGSLATTILQRFELLDVVVDTSKPAKFCLIQRANKRIILNDWELLALAESMGFEALELVLEQMSAVEQLGIIRQCSVLAGAHGSGMANVLFMSPDSVLIHILPYKVCEANFFISMARQANVRYLEWINTNIDNTVFHEHFLPSGRKLKEFVDSVECAAPGSNVFFSFWINQDTIVDIEEFTVTLQEAKALLPWFSPNTNQ